jgi:hypothetical protein
MSRVECDFAHRRSARSTCAKFQVSLTICWLVLVIFPDAVYVDVVFQTWGLVLLDSLNHRIRRRP